MGTVNAVEGAAKYEQEAGKLTDQAAHREKEEVRVMKQQAHDETAETESMTKFPAATKAGKEALRKVADEVVRNSKETSKLMKQEGNSFADSGSLMAQARETEAQADSLKQRLPHPSTEQRLCVDLPGVQLKTIRGVSGGNRAETSDELCKQTCTGKEKCKQLVFSKEGGCHISEEATMEVVSFSDSFSSSYCGLIKEKD